MCDQLGETSGIDEDVESVVARRDRTRRGCDAASVLQHDLLRVVSFAAQG